MCFGADRSSLFDSEAHADPLQDLVETIELKSLGSTWIGISSIVYPIDLYPKTFKDTKAKKLATSTRQTGGVTAEDTAVVVEPILLIAFSARLRFAAKSRVPMIYGTTNNITFSYLFPYNAYSFLLI